LRSRFQQVQAPQRYRRASVYSSAPYDLEVELGKLPIWEPDASSALGLPRRRVAQLVETVARLDPQDRQGDAFYRRLRQHHGCNVVQAGLVQYCCARVGIVDQPEVPSEAVELLQKVLVDRANHGLTAAVDRELDALARMTQREPKEIGFNRLGSRDILNVRNNQILTGLTE
jgi:hypothetical protein